jgi:hypothetical protein
MRVSPKRMRPAVFNHINADRFVHHSFALVAAPTLNRLPPDLPRSRPVSLLTGREVHLPVSDAILNKRNGYCSKCACDGADSSL